MYWPSVRPPGSLTTPEIRELWRLRLSLLALKPEVDPEQDFESFARFIRACHVGRVYDEEGRVVATMSYARLDGQFEGQRWCLANYEYAFIEPHMRSHPAIVAMYIMLFYGCLSWRPGVRNFLCFVGYPKTVLTYAKRVPELKLDADPSLDALELHLIERYIERLVQERFDPDRRVVWMPTIPPRMSSEWLARNAEDPLLASYLERSPRWQEGEALIAISRLDDGLRLVRELGVRVLARAKRASSERKLEPLR